jgi:prepilin signal peptidase PulO-like enzyme (type II secretory pathway)
VPVKAATSRPPTPLVPVGRELCHGSGRLRDWRARQRWPTGSAAPCAILFAVSSTTPRIRAQHRYGLVLVLTIAAVLEVIVAPDTPVSRGIALMVQGATLLAVIATTRERRLVQGVTGALACLAIFGLALAVALSLAPRWLASAMAVVVVSIVLYVLVRGVARLIRTRGVTLQAVAGALSIYLLAGLAFALAINLIARLGPTYFVQGPHEALSEQVYFSFTTMTTTGYGDLTPATNVGHALAVLEMLLGRPPGGLNTSGAA